MEESAESRQAQPSEADRPRDHADLSLVGGYRVVGASVLGRGHAHQGRPRDDAFELRADASAEPPWWFAAIADGAGSRPDSRFAALAVTRAAAEAASMRRAEGATPRDVMLAAVDAAHAAQRATAAERAVDIGEMSCTLLCLLCAVGADGVTAVTFQIGDGLIACSDDAGMLFPLAAADDDVPGFTWFLEMLEDPAPRIREHGFVAPPRGFLIATDGVSDDLIPLTDNGPILAGELAGIAALEGGVDAGVRLAEVLDYEKRGSFDDRTLVMAWR
jgi:hypothetical protein